MPFLIVAEWDADLKPVSINSAETREQADQWLADNSELFPDAIVQEMDNPNADPSCMTVDPVNKTVVFNDIEAAVKSIGPFLDKHRKKVGDSVVEHNGIEALGNKSTRAAISETVQFLQEIPADQRPATIDWEAHNGFKEVTLTELIDLGKKIGLHRQKTFSVKKAVMNSVEAGTITTREAAQAAFDAGMVA